MKKAFPAKLRESGNGTYEITIPKPLVDYLGLEVGKDYSFKLVEDGENE